MKKIHLPIKIPMERKTMPNTRAKKVYDKTIVIPIERQMWMALRKIAYEKEISMSQLTRWAIEKIINKYDKGIDTQ